MTHFLTEEDHVNLKALETPLKILKETIVKHFPTYTNSYYLENIYSNIVEFILKGKEVHEDLF